MFAADFLLVISPKDCLSSVLVIHKIFNRYLKFFSVSFVAVLVLSITFDSA